MGQLDEYNEEIYICLELAICYVVFVSFESSSLLYHSIEPPFDCLPCLSIDE